MDKCRITSKPEYNEPKPIPLHGWMDEIQNSVASMYVAGSELFRVNARLVSRGFTFQSSCVLRIALDVPFCYAVLRENSVAKPLDRYQPVY
jgi:hypothetical protein